MAIFKKKKEKYVDLSEKMRKRDERVRNFKSSKPEVEETPVETSSSNGGGFFGGFFGGGNSSASSNSDPETSPEVSDEKRKRLAKRLSDMTSKMEEMEKEIYQLKQKLEVIEKKQRLGY